MSGNGTDMAVASSMLPEQVLEMIVAGGDLGKLSPAQRTQYLVALCNSLGLNALSRPIEFINLNGKTVPYAKKDCTEQLRRIHNISITIAGRETTEGVYTVTARATTPEGRTDEDVGSVVIANLKGDNLANATMKAHTKAKRRVTLSICGLGLLDESELDTVPGARTLSDFDPEPIAKQLPKSAEPDNEVVELWSDRMARAEDIESLDVVRAQCKAEVTDKATLNVIAKRYAGFKKDIEEGR